MGMAQGLTEFLPVSSSGHLALLGAFFQLNSSSLVFEVGVHLGTLFSIFTVYRKIIGSWFMEVMSHLRTLKLNDGAYLFYLVIIASLPAGVIGILLKDFIIGTFSNLLIVGGSFLFTGCVLFAAEKSQKGKEIGAEMKGFGELSDVRSINLKQAFLIGWAQALAILPGVSRSGSTISMALFLGVPRKTSALFSFLMSIPVILGAGILQIKDIGDLPAADFKYLVFSFIISYIFGLVGLLGILYFVKKAQLDRFSWYLWAIGFGSIAFYFAGG